MTLRAAPLAFVLLALGGGCKPPPVATPAEAVAGCTEEARVCADGSTVARQGPDCEFPRCPTDPDNGLGPDPAPAGPDGETAPLPMGTFDSETSPG